MNNIIKCKHCEYEWSYKGSSLYYITCPRCLKKLVSPFRKGNLSSNIKDIYINIDYDEKMKGGGINNGRK